MNNIIYVVLVAIMILFLWACIDSTIKAKRNWHKIKKAWGNTGFFEKKLLYLGVLFFIFVPAFREHPSASYYSSKVIIEILPALASSFLVVGIIGFMRNLHDINQENI
jgi:hypothetical protein